MNHAISVGNQAFIRNWIAAHTPYKGRVLDVGCGDGDLLAQLQAQCHLTVAAGIEIDENHAINALEHGISVHHGNADDVLSDYPDKLFDIVIMSMTIQELDSPSAALRECLRIGRQGVVVFPNFGHWRARLQLGLLGHAPSTPELPHQWHSSPNKHFFTIADWEDFCNERDMHVKILDKAFTANGKEIHILPNLRAELAVYLLEWK